MPLPTLENIGGHPLVDFTNTELFCQKGKPIEFLQTLSDFLDWLEKSGGPTLQASSFPPATHPIHLRKIRAFRTLIREMLEALLTNGQAPDKALKKINHHLNQRKCETLVVRSEGKYLTQTNHRLSGRPCFLGFLAEFAADFLTNADWYSLKLCEHDHCLRFFLDQTKNNSRRWCSMELCGNRMKAKRHYEQIKKGQA